MSSYNTTYHYQFGNPLKPEAADTAGIQSAGFEDNNVRRVFIRKVFGQFISNRKVSFRCTPS